MSHAVLEKIRSADNLPSLPTVAVEVLRLTKHEGASVEDLAGIIQNDPALTAKMLKVVNSSLFGIPREIASLTHAIGLLGLRRVKIMALSFSLVDALRATEGRGFDFEGYWRRSLSSAVAARLIGKAVAPQLAEEAFIVGLLSDIGMVGAWRCAPEMYQPILDAWAASERPLTEIEMDRFGFTHASMSREMFKTWGLPETVCEAVGAHHGEGLSGLSGASRRLAGVAYSAAAIADVFCQDIPSRELDRVKAQCLEETGIDEAKLEAVLEALDQHIRDTALILSVKVGETVNYADLQAEATMQMAQLSMEAEAERDESARREQQARMETERLNEEKRAILEVASTDALTKVANRAAFDKRLDEELKRAHEKGHPLGLIFMDVDCFKRFNDAYGHQAGDDVLRTVGACLGEVVRNTGFVARYGGEEFAVILAGEAAGAIRAMAEEIRTTIEARPVEHDGRKLYVTASFGIACVEGGSAPVTYDQLIEQADRYLYQAKRNGRNRVETAG